ASLEYSRLAFSPADKVVKAVGWLFAQGRAAKTIAVLTIATILIAAALLIPAPFQLKGEGTLMPIATREIFVHTAGVVQNVKIKHGDAVKQGEVLLTLRNVDLEVAYEDLLGQRRTAQEELLSVQRTLLDEKNIEPLEKSRLAGRRSEL